MKLNKLLAAILVGVFALPVLAQNTTAPAPAGTHVAMVKTHVQHHKKHTKYKKHHAKQHM